MFLILSFPPTDFNTHLLFFLSGLLSVCALYLIMLIEYTNRAKNFHCLCAHSFIGLEHMKIGGLRDPFDLIFFLQKTVRPVSGL